MNKEEMNIDWESKYRIMKKKLNDLKDLRHDSVRVDLIDLKKKIEEHRKIHEMSVHELRQQNSQLEQNINELKHLRNDLDRKSSIISNLKKEISFKDLTLKIILQYPLIRVINCNKNKYEISTSGNQTLLFTLLKENEYTYSPQRLPNWISIPQFLKDTITFDLNKLSDFCSALSIAIQDNLH